MNNVFVIAEAGVNHNGSILLAKRLIDAAVKAGADAVKFQTFKSKNMVSKHAQKADYQKNTTDKNESQFDMLKKLELNEYQHKTLIKYCKKKKIMFLSSPFDLESIDLLNRLHLPIIKIPSGEITNLLYLKKIGMLNKRVILSTGMSNIKEIREALSVLVSCGTKKKNITILHCNTQYPTPFADVNLRAIERIRKTFNTDVGYSDHTQGIEVAIAAVALGAQIIEKHITISNSLPGPDHRASLEPQEFSTMVKSIRNISKALGNFCKVPSKSEIKNINVARKSLVAKMNINKGELFTNTNITAKRPGNGLNPMTIHQILGKKAKCDFKKDETISI